MFQAPRAGDGGPEVVTGSSNTLETTDHHGQGGYRWGRHSQTLPMPTLNSAVAPELQQQKQQQPTTSFICRKLKRHASKTLK